MITLVLCLLLADPFGLRPFAGPVVQSAVPPLGLTLPCRVLVVHDGDTATKVEIRIVCSVRYDNLYSPELSEPGGREAAKAAKLAEGRAGRLHIPMGSAKNLADLFTFGRVVGEIFLDGEAESESAKQVRLGHGVRTKD